MPVYATSGNDKHTLYDELFRFESDWDCTYHNAAFQGGLQDCPVGSSCSADRTSSAAHFAGGMSAAVRMSTLIRIDQSNVFQVLIPMLPFTPQ